MWGCVSGLRVSGQSHIYKMNIGWAEAGGDPGSGWAGEPPAQADPPAAGLCAEGSARADDDGGSAVSCVAVCVSCSARCVCLFIGGVFSGSGTSPLPWGPLLLPSSYFPIKIWNCHPRNPGSIHIQIRVRISGYGSRNGQIQRANPTELWGDSGVYRLERGARVDPRAPGGLYFTLLYQP